MQRWWHELWFARIPPHIYSLLRIAFGALALFHLIALSDVDAYWVPDGLIPASSHQAVSARIIAWGLGRDVGIAWLVVEIACFTAMTIGFRTTASVALSFVAGIGEMWWNSLPLSAAFQIVLNVIFCLLWADCGAVWSVDAYLQRRSRERDRVASQGGLEAIWPLRLIRYQVALVYFATAIWKLQNPIWRNGTALHDILRGSVFPRLPFTAPPALDGVLRAATYATLGWELLFPLLLLNRTSRRVALGSGVVIHLAMGVVFELGLFSPVMLATYLAFLDPGAVARWIDQTIRAQPPLDTLKINLPASTD
jgi:hypothetical protein